MKTIAILFAVLACAAFGQGHVAAANSTQIQLELSRLNQQLQHMQQVQAKGVPSYVPGESADQRKARHAKAVADAEAAYIADWQNKNPLLPSFRAPKFHKQLADQAIAASDGQAAANAGARPTQQAPDNRAQLAALQRQIKALEARLKAAQVRK